MQFNQPDSVIPEPYNTLDWNRYAYARYNPLIYTDPTGHDPVLGFIQGFLNELNRTNAWFAPGYQEKFAIRNGETDAELTGRLVADVVSLGIGSVEAGGGTFIAASGVAACGTGVLCLAGAPAIVGGGTLIVQGAGTVLRTAEGAGTTLVMLAGRGSSQLQFGSPSRLTDHFKKHGAEFGYSTESEYLKGAQNFIGTEGSDNVLTLTRRNGDKVLFNQVTNEFAVVAPDGTIRTYFKPDPAIHGYKTNLEYFNAQRNK